MGPGPGNRQHPHHPFHCPTFLSRETSDTLFRENPRNPKTGKKTLEWSTICYRIVKMDGFENRCGLWDRECQPGNVTELITFNPVYEKPRPRSRVSSRC